MDSSRSDHSLVRRVRDGDDRAASALFARYARRMHGLAARRMGRDLATRVDVDDVVQSAFGSFFRAAREGAYAAPDGGELWQLLAAITRHKLRRVRVYHQARKRDVRRTTGGESALGLSDDAPPAAEWKWLVEDLFAALRPVERQIVELRMAGHLVAEIAARCGRSKRTIERVLQEVRDELCRRLEDPR